MAINTIWVFETLAIDINIPLQITPDGHHVGRVKALVPVHQAWGLERREEYPINLTIRNNVLNLFLGACPTIHYNKKFILF